MLISLLLGVLIGITLGLTGAGGGILAVPALVFGMGWSVQKATPVALIAVAASAALGAIQAFRQKLVRYKAAVLMATSGIPFTLLGSYIAQYLPARFMLVIFATVMLLVAIRLLKKLYLDKLEQQNPQDAAPCKTNPESGRFIWSWPTGLWLGSTGAVAGLMTGLLGVGGGFIIVPIMRKLTTLSTQAIIATSLLVITLVSTGSIISALIHGAVIPLQVTLFFMLATAIGMTVGRGILPYLPDRAIQQGFAYILILVSCSLLLKAALFL